MATDAVLGVLPMRGGSKGIPRKNSREILGFPLLTWAARSLAECPAVDRAICSTDSRSLASLAHRCGLEIPWLRDKSLGLDATPVVEVLIDILRHKGMGPEDFEYVAMVQQPARQCAQS